MINTVVNNEKWNKLLILFNRQNCKQFEGIPNRTYDTDSVLPDGFKAFDLHEFFIEAVKAAKVLFWF